MGRPLIDLAGKRFGRLTVVAIDHMADGGARWACRCDCGQTTLALGHHLRQGLKWSCGCARGTHHQSATKLYRTWVEMIRRCHNPMNKGYKNYGARGISVCSRWRESFEAFHADMGDRPTAWHSLDRINNDGGYEPGNCRWGTLSEQAQNTRLTRRVQYSDGRTKTLREVENATGLSARIIRGRFEAGWSGDDIERLPKLPRHLARAGRSVQC